MTKHAIYAKPVPICFPDLHFLRRLPKWQVSCLALKIRDPKARADLEDNLRGARLTGAEDLTGANNWIKRFLSGL